MGVFMAQGKFFVVKDGTQMEGHYGDDQVKGILAENPSSTFLVWKEGMANWVDPKTLPEFAQSAPTPAPPPAGAPAPPPPAAPAASPGMDQMKAGGKAILGGAKQHFAKVKDAKDTYSYLPHLKFVDTLLNWIRRLISAERLDQLDELAKKVGHFALLISAVFIFIYGIIYGARAGSFLSSFGMHLLIFPIVVIAQYAAVKFLDAGHDLISKSPSSLSSKAFLDCFALLIAIAVIGTFGGSIVGGIMMRSFMPFVSGLGMTLILIYTLAVALNASTVNVGVATDATAGQEAIGIFSFFIKLNLRIVPFIYGVVCALGPFMVIYFIIKVIGADDEFGVMMVGVGASSSFAMIVGVAFLPFLAYLMFLFFYLLFDMIRAVLVVPGKLDVLAGKQD